MNAELLLHICCAPCGGSCVERLIAAGRPPCLYYSNSNLESRAEFDRRLESVVRLAEHFQLPLEVDPYDHDAWLKATAGLENEPEGGRRCARCFAFSLGRAAAFAAGKPFCTTLTVSPCKSSAVLFAVGASWPEFEAIDFKKRDGYRRSCEIARELGFYRQNFCGCEFSHRRPEPSRADS